MQLALSSGADDALRLARARPGRAASGARPYGATLVLDFVGIDDDAPARRHLCSATAGTSRSSGSVAGASRHGPGLPLEWSVSRISNGTVPELQEVVELARRGDISLEVERVALEDVIGDLRAAARGLGRRAAGGDPVSGASETTLELAGFLDTGLDLSTDSITESERQRTLAWYREHHDHGDLDLAPFARFQTPPRPGDASSACAGTSSRSAREPEEGPLPIGVAVLLYIHAYAVLGNGKGTLYEIIAARALGVTRADVVETLGARGAAGRPSLGQRSGRVRR